MGLFTTVSAYSCHVWPFAAKIADNIQTYCWHVYALNVGNMKTWQYCNFIVQDKIHAISVTICCREWLYGYSRCKFTTYYIQGSIIMNIIKSTKNCVYHKVWLNRNIKAFYDLEVRRPHFSFRQCVFESCLNIETKIDTPIVL